MIFRTTAHLEAQHVILQLILQQIVQTFRLEVYQLHFLFHHLSFLCFDQNRMFFFLFWVVLMVGVGKVKISIISIHFSCL